MVMRVPAQESRPANVLVTVVVSYLIGLPVACCLGGALGALLGGGSNDHLVGPLALIFGLLG
jgi:hypothetical protein